MALGLLRLRVARGLRRLFAVARGLGLGRAEIGQAAARLVVVEVRPADPRQEAGVVVLPERPVRPRGRHGGPGSAERRQPERVVPEPAGRSGALPPPGGRRVDDRPLPGQRVGLRGEPDEADALPGQQRPVDRRSSVLIGRDVQPAHRFAGSLRDLCAGEGDRGERQRHRNAAGRRGAQNGHSQQCFHRRNVITTVQQLSRRNAGVMTDPRLMTGSGPHAATALPLARSRYAHGQ